jgi:asparagine synthase (glutamine-hydrolysing)
MTVAISHRGPDDHGVWADPGAGIALGHRRLSIIDLSREGHQPMLSTDHRFVISYNGEVYNFDELRRQLQACGHSFRGTSDTEVILAAVLEWGISGALQRFIGMFAIALWDQQTRSLHLIRDRLGIKPLYYGWVGSSFVFASELKAVCAHPDFTRELDHDVVPLYFRYGYVPSPLSIYQGMAALSPGSILTLDQRGLADRQVRVDQYWSAHDVVAGATANRLQISEEEATDQLEQLLTDSIRLRMVSDVPLGAFLSGGIDSSAVVALMQSISSSKVKTFTIGFHEQEYNEAVHAAAVARHLGTDHTELYLSDQEAMEVIPKISEIYDEPFADSSQIPTFLVSWLARQHVTVALTGDGGDELLGGYDRYPFIARDWRSKSRLPVPLRRLLAATIRLATRPHLSWLLNALVPVLWLRGRSMVNLSERALRRAKILDDVVFDDFYNHHGSFAVNPDLELVLEYATEPLTKLADPGTKPELRHVVERMMFMDLIQYLPDDILTKVDRASMAVSLETRVPVIDHRLVELAWQLSFSHKVEGSTGKKVLRRLLHKYVPASLVERPKMGFGVPFAEWIREPLRDWAEELLSPAALEEGGVLQTEYVRRSWLEHCQGAHDHRNLLWPVLMFQAWRKHWRV